MGRDYSLGTEMEEAVEAFDTLMVVWEKGMLGVEWNDILYGGKPSKARFARYAGINPKTFQKYVCSDITKRRAVGTKPGRPRNNGQEQDEERFHKTWYSYYHSLIHGPEDPAAKLLEFRKKQQGFSRSRKFYKELNNLESPPKRERTPAQKQYEKEQIIMLLPRVCLCMGADENFLRTELDFVERCFRSYGANEQPYHGPGMNDTPLGKTTKNRRNKMTKGLGIFELTQTRRALSMLVAGAGRREILVAIDYLLRKYDQGLVTQGLQPSGLRSKVHETNHFLLKDLKNKKRKKSQIESEDWETKDSELTPEDVNKFRSRVVSEINKELTTLDETNHNHIQMKIWEKTQQILAGPLTEFDLEPLLETLETLQQKMQSKSQLEEGSEEDCSDEDIVGGAKVLGHVNSDILDTDEEGEKD